MEKDLDTSNFMAMARRIPGLDAAYAVEVIGGSEPLYKKILQQAIRLLPSCLQDMERSIRTDDWGTFAVKTHGIKGTLNQIGSFSLAKRGEALETAAKEGDPAFCREHYQDFREDLLGFFAKLEALLEQDQTGMAPKGQENGDIRRYIGLLSRAKKALEDFDTLLALDTLSPLAELRFGDGTDALMDKAIKALELFQPQKALDCISVILSGHECPETQA